MEPLGLRDRDLAVLRGLLSFVKPEAWAGAVTVFASNKVLQERCGGMDERTLRRRLARLCEVGLIGRTQSPNRKRYVVRDEAGAVVLTYGFDLSPLRAALPRIADMAEAARLVALRLRMLRSVLRDRLYQLTVAGLGPDLCAATAKLLRRKVEPEALTEAIDALDRVIATKMTASDSQIDRDIQISNEEPLDTKEVALEECLQSAPNAACFASEPPKTWAEAADLALALAPAIGIDAVQMQRSWPLLGKRGATLAVLGLVESHGRIKHPARYLESLTQKAAKGLLNLDRMFRSLTQTARFPAGNLA